MAKKSAPDSIQLKQKLIYYKAELEKYKDKVQDYQDNYHYAMLEKLKKENEMLVNDNESLSIQLRASKEEFNRRLQAQENQGKVYKEKGDEMQKEITALKDELTTKKKATEELIEEVTAATKELEHLKKIRSSLQTKKFSLESQLQKTENEYTQYKLDTEEKMQKLNEVLKDTEAALTRKTTEKEQISDEYAHVKRALQDELAHQVNITEELNERIERLSEENVFLKEKNEAFRQEEELFKTISSALPSKDTERAFEQNNLDKDQLIEQIGSAINYEGPLNFYPYFIDFLENKVAELTEEIDAFEKD
ncbi:hypothetical protein MUN89_04525 [Halobacillus salinarum]|uniref:Uncharacterized protein n=1 Tax=Halobacillus salinarum TaxID=2932257 RepID=A0ABY4EL74_9BACI|nr:hypothetical protein [Halobacillus salinarum]UOQ45219.1 hypothetical protein MUN89_04525 [Halobacillus salinarum]